MQNTIADYFKTQPVLKAWLFGSFARGEETPLSDVDILISLDYSIKNLLFCPLYIERFCHLFNIFE